MLSKIQALIEQENAMRVSVPSGGWGEWVVADVILSKWLTTGATIRFAQQQGYLCKACGCGFEEVRDTIKAGHH